MKHLVAGALVLVLVPVLLGGCGLGSEVHGARDGLGADHGQAGQAAEPAGIAGEAGAGAATEPDLTEPGRDGGSGDVQLSPGLEHGDTPQLHPPAGDPGEPVEVPTDIVDCERPANIIEHGPFELELEWDWQGPAGSELGLPLVANLTDDNGDARIDTRDTPDVVVKATLGDFLVLLDGGSGALHAMFPAAGPYGSFPALGDVNGDGSIEIVTHDELAGIVALDAQGSAVWRAPPTEPFTGVGTITLADLDQDGLVETLSDGVVLSSRGDMRRMVTADGHYAPSLAADLDGDGALELIFGNRAYRTDGSVYYEATADNLGGQVADFDLDGVPEVVLTGNHAIIVLEHDGTLRREVELEAADANNDYAIGPAVLGYIDGDAELDIAVMSRQWLSVLRSSDLSVVWRTAIGYGAYVFGSTGFDFDGDGTTELVIVDLERLRILDGSSGGEIAGYDLPEPQSIGYPTIADVDNDGSAEILVALRGEQGTRSHVMAFGAPPGKSFMSARRIWNQYQYSVTNIEEDGSFPRPLPPSWLVNNTYRVQSSILPDGTLCTVGTRP